MKARRIKLIAALILTVGILANASANTGGPDKDKNVFVIRADKNMIGAKVVIFDPSGGKLATKILKNKKTAIDFRNMQIGEYTIRVYPKNNRTKEYHFTKE